MAKANSIGLSVGKSASKEYFDFASVFEPMCADTPAGEKLREEGFLAADPNGESNHAASLHPGCFKAWVKRRTSGMTCSSTCSFLTSSRFLHFPIGNGLCSLAELETFLLKGLLTKFPNTGKGNARKTPGQDLWDAYRPCYIRAFKDAADYAPDYGEKIKGTKNAKQDDFVSKDEFKIFCCYVIIYAAMFDAFSKIDGGGSGRDAGDDKRIEEAEFLKGYKGVAEHGFLALQNIPSDEAAKEVRIY